MKKLAKNDYINILSIGFLLLLYVIIMTKNFTFIYGSTTDWDCQHWIFPDYFRQLFYNTGKLIPNFAFNIGGGQNIYNFSYYGLLSPIIILSYFFPFIRMVDYIQIISVVGLFISIYLFYRWILNKYDSKIAFLTTLVFISSGPLLFHSHRHIMFINYMPFLILALIGMDIYFETGKKSLLILSIFSIIMTSYFFSVSAIFMVGVYWLGELFRRNKKVDIAIFGKNFLKILPIVFTGIGMAAVLIFPTFNVLLSGRAKSNVVIAFSDILRPCFNISSLFYSMYSPGLKVLSFFALFHVFYKNSKYKFLAFFLIAILIFPIFTYILNGTMYIDYKILITSIPLVMLLTASMLNSLDEAPTLKEILAFIGILAIFVMANIHSQLLKVFIIESATFLGFIYIYKKFPKNFILYSFIFIIALASAVSTSSDKLIKRENLEKFLADEKDIYKEILAEDGEIFRIFNQNSLLQNLNRVPSLDYYIGSVYSSVSNAALKNFYYENSGVEITERSYGKVSNSLNIIYNFYLGEKYLIKDKYVPIGFKQKYGDLYENPDVLPIIYASNRTLSKSDFDNLKFPYRMEALLNYIVVEDEGTDTFSSSIQEYNGNFSVLSNPDRVSISKNGDSYEIDVSKKSKIVLGVSNLQEGEIFILKFRVDNDNVCPQKDLSITINGMENVLTCKNWKYHNRNYDFEYVISSESRIENLEVVMTKGKYKISSIETYRLPYNGLVQRRREIDQFRFDKAETKGDVIVGTIDVKNDGYLNMSIPYDRGYTLYIDGKSRTIENVDENFMGVKIEKGHHDIKIVYEAPLLKVGKIISLFSFIVYINILYREKIMRQKT